MTLDVLGEPLVELFVRVEQGRHDEVKQRPQLQHSPQRSVGHCSSEVIKAAKKNAQLSPCHCTNVSVSCVVAYLRHAVLNRSSRQQQPVATTEAK